MAEMAAFLFLVAVFRGVHAVAENPAASMVFNHEAFCKCLQSLDQTILGSIASLPLFYCTLLLQVCQQVQIDGQSCMGATARLHMSMPRR